MLDVDVIDDPAVAATALEPVRARILAELRSPGSASTVAAAIGETRQKVNYHLRALETHGLVTLVEERPRRGLTERIMQASAASYAVSPAVFGDQPPDPATAIDHLSSRYLMAIAARLLREVTDLVRGADAAGKPLATLTIDTEIRFASAADRAAFTAELGQAINSLAGRYHRPHHKNGRWHRLVVAAHPRPAPQSPHHKEPSHDR